MFSALMVLFLSLFVLALLAATIIYYHYDQKSLRNRFDEQSEAYRYF